MLPLTSRQKQLAADNVRLVYKTVNTYAATLTDAIRERFGWSNDDIVSYLWPHYLQAISYYDPARGALGTIVVLTLRQRLRSILASNDREFSSDVDGVIDDGALGNATVEATEDRERQRAAIAAGLEVLTERERACIEAYYLAEDTAGQITYEDLGQQFGLSRERIRQIMRQALTKLREHMEANDLCAAI